jgi:hypothetical protein
LSCDLGWHVGAISLPLVGAILNELAPTSIGLAPTSIKIAPTGIEIAPTSIKIAPTRVRV